MILHLCVLDKFIEPFYAFVKANFEGVDAEHVFYINGTSSVYRTPAGENVFLAQRNGPYTRITWLIEQMRRADKIILHGLWDLQVLILLSVQPWLLKKCCWVIWGGDLYTHKQDERTLSWWKFELLRRFTIKRMGHFVTHIHGDYELAKKWYGAKGLWHECFMYPSNLYHEYPVESASHEEINILVGNSADPSNNHIEILDKLRAYTNERIKIYCPLSYGDAGYAQKIIEYGKELFGEKFIALREFMPFESYLELLALIDIAVFNHKRQQGMGNTTTLLGLGKKVYMRNDVTPWDMYENINVKVFSIADFSLDAIGSVDAERNCLSVASYFSHEKLKEQWSRIYE